MGIEPDNRGENPLTQPDDSSTEESVAVSQTNGTEADSEKSTGEPVIGIVATEENDDEVARVCLRARANDLQVIVVIEEDEPGIPELAELPGVTTVRPYKDTDGHLENADRARHTLNIAAQTKVDTGLIIVGDTSLPVDFERSLEAFEKHSFICDAVHERSRTIDTLVAIPAYNEGNTIANVVEKASCHADDVLVIDDGSADETAVRAETAGATVVTHEQNEGYGVALKTAFEAADKLNVEYLVIVDGDDQHDTNDIPELTSIVQSENANVAIGSRFSSESKRDVPTYRRLGISVINIMANLSMGALSPGSWIMDTQSGFRAYDAEAIETLADADLGDDMDASLDILYHLHEEDFKLEETPTVVNYKVENGHSQNPVAHGVRLVSSILRTVERDHPVKFLGIPGVLMALLGSGFGYAAMVNYLDSQTFPLGLALVSVFFILLGVFSGFTAIMLHSLNAHFND